MRRLTDKELAEIKSEMLRMKAIPEKYNTIESTMALYPKHACKRTKQVAAIIIDHVRNLIIVENAYHFCLFRQAVEDFIKTDLGGGDRNITIPLFGEVTAKVLAENRETINFLWNRYADYIACEGILLVKRKNKLERLKKLEE